MLLPILLLLTAEPPKPLVDYPYPLITEVLYAVPTGEAGDANGDGSRETSGDEFVELVNPHDRSIDLRGYVLSGKASTDPSKKFKALRFVFPNITLQPGQVAVVFNGHKQKWTGPVGDTTHAPDGGNSKFAGALVFTMNAETAHGFSNKADYVLMTAPDGTPVQCIKWGDIKPPTRVKLLEEAPAAEKGSIMRRTVDGSLEPHPYFNGRHFSPGKFPIDAPTPPGQTPPAAPSAQPPAPAPATPAKPSSPKKKSG